MTQNAQVQHVSGTAGREGSLWRWLAGFALAQAVVLTIVFQGGLWGSSLLAPIDIAPALFPKYRALDANSTGVPANHHIIDQLTYDLPLQYTIHEALQRGEVPWWDPYTLGGRPLLADATISGTDPIRWLLYRLFSFEAAYNWVRVLHSIFTGLGMLLLLWRAGFALWISLPLAVAYQFAGGHILFYGQTWIQASLLYYPFLWLAWDAVCTRGKRWGMAVAPLLIAGIFLAGNLQSHSYVVVFARAFLLGYAGRDWRKAGRIAAVLVATGLLGACLAGPALGAQLEALALSSRKIEPLFKPLTWFSAFGSLAGVYPWGLGTFRTLDLSKLLAQVPLGFALFIGCAGFVLAVLGTEVKPSHERRPFKRTALWLLAGYLFIISTPLVGFLYMRTAALGAMALVFLAAMGAEMLAASDRARRRAGWGVLTVALAAAISTNVFAFAVYPKLLPKVKQVVANHEQDFGHLERAQEVRAFQIETLPAEISFRNLETVAGFLALAALGLWLLRPPTFARTPLLACLLVLNVLPVLHYARRFVPRQPVELWRQLLAGGPEQRRVRDVLGDTPLRLFEVAPGSYEQVFVLELSHLQRVRVVHAYATLFPTSLHNLPPAERERWKPQLADWIYESPQRGMAAGQLYANATPGLARFQWEGRGRRPFTVEQEGLNTIRLTLQPGEAGTLLWSDTYYPGWKAIGDGTPLALRPVEPCFTRLEVPASVRTIVLHYEPRFLPAGKVSAIIGLTGVLLVGFWPRSKKGAKDPTEKTAA
jgi:hypothetical protein